jgi:hypothetical protein
VVRCQAVAIPSDDADSEDAPNGASVALFDDSFPNLFSLLRGKRHCCALFTSFLSDVDTKELEALDPLHHSPINVNWAVLGLPLFPVVHDQLLCLSGVKGEVIVLAPHSQVTDLLPIGN